MITMFMSEDFVTVGADAKTWEEAIFCAGDLMLRNGCIESSYIDRMIESTRVMGPYIVIAPGLALAHARPGRDVNRACVSVATLKRPVVFGNPEHDPVSIVIGFAAPDDNTHMEVITYIAKLISSGAFGCVCDCRTAGEVVKQITSADIKLFELMPAKV